MIIGIAGKAKSGKDQLAIYLWNYFAEKYKIEFRFDAFARELKQMCVKQFALTKEQLWGEHKERMTPYGKNELGRLGLSSNPADYWTPREIMQALGAFYRTIDYDFWVKKLDENFQKSDQKDVIITDIRHINECEYVKKHGTLIKLARGEQQKIHGMDHESEVSLDGKPDEYFDIVLNNDGTLDDLRQASKNVADAIMKLQNLKNEGKIYNG
jgi:hypothetical protein